MAEPQWIRALPADTASLVRAADWERIPQACAVPELGLRHLQGPQIRFRSCSLLPRQQGLLDSSLGDI